MSGNEVNTWPLRPSPLHRRSRRSGAAPSRRGAPGSTGRSRAGCRRRSRPAWSMELNTVAGSKASRNAQVRSRWSRRRRSSCCRCSSRRATKPTSIHRAAARPGPRPRGGTAPGTDRHLRRPPDGGGRWRDRPVRAGRPGRRTRPRTGRVPARRWLAGDPAQHRARQHRSRTTGCHRWRRPRAPGRRSPPWACIASPITYSRSIGAIRRQAVAPRPNGVRPDPFRCTSRCSPVDVDHLTHRVALAVAEAWA